ncbi:sigma factor-like helix-turn-helix DNA-binding protein [Mycoplasma struthionis]|uniref:Sigma-70 family RNA polymerase sigma factor n=1 Tax=Mycoplasma struthionis TaxID=538220 RepID=A0A3G8LFW9_9MOLU|nr:sigma factor-like helix-turn-helix DNA-binding protein [Mycoplasma struthionis]AZG68526.1 hypothetical protein EGN60_00870 [Mycoplasma struthionis]TPI02486.1 hypothetical protein FJM01_00680 [Mycoplasma struthionis]
MANNDLDKREHYLDLFEKYENFLSKGQKQVLQLYFFEDLSITEIAEELAMTRSGVHDALTKGRDKLDKINEKMKGN